MKFRMHMKPGNVNGRNQLNEINKKSKFIVNFKKIEIIMIKCLLDFLTLEDVSKFSIVNKACNDIFKTYIHIRIHIETDFIKVFETDNTNLISSIDAKRLEYCTVFEIEIPNKEKAIINLTTISSLVT